MRYWFPTVFEANDSVSVTLSPYRLGDHPNISAGIAMVGLGAIRPHDVAYPTAFIDGDGKTLWADFRRPET